MIVARKYRLYPTEEQKAFFANSFGCTRFVYNHFLEVRNTEYEQNNKTLSYVETSSMLTQLKMQYEWLYEVSADCLQQSLRHLDNAFTNFFRQQSAYPKFKSKKSNRDSFSFPQYVYLKDGKLSVPRCREGIKIKLHRPIEGKIKTTTISKNAANQYFVSMNIEVPDTEPIKSVVTPETIVGIDLGVKTFATFDSGKKINNPKYFAKSRDKLAKEQRKFARMQKGSNNSKKQRLKVARTYQKITNQRDDFLHKLTYNLTHDNQVNMICIEDLAVKELLQEKLMSKSIADVSWRRFRQLLEYKCRWYGKTLFVIDKYAPSSKLCRNCGHINNDLKLEDREWTCPKCGKYHDRDINAAQNIRAFGLEYFYRNESYMKYK